MKMVLSPLRSLLRYVLPVRPIIEAAVELIDISVGPLYDDKIVYYCMGKGEESSPESKDEEKQRKLWQKSLEWCKITALDTPLKTAFDGQCNTIL
jgi:hypothetical protein